MKKSAKPLETEGNTGTSLFAPVQPLGKPWGDGLHLSPPKESNTTRLLRCPEAIRTEPGPSRRAEATDSQHRLPLLVGGTEAIIPPRGKACGATSAHPRDHLTTLVACRDHAVVLRRRPTLGAGIANLLHGLPLIVGRTEAVIAPTRKALWTDSAHLHKGATGIATLGGKAVAAGGDVAGGATAVVGQRSYGLLPGRDGSWSGKQPSTQPTAPMVEGRRKSAAAGVDWAWERGGWGKGRGLIHLFTLKWCCYWLLMRQSSICSSRRFRNSAMSPRLNLASSLPQRRARLSGSLERS